MQRLCVCDFCGVTVEYYKIKKLTDMFSEVESKEPFLSHFSEPIAPRAASFTSSGSG